MNDFIKRLIEKHEGFAREVGLEISEHEYSEEFGGSGSLKYQGETVSLLVTKSRDGLSYYVGAGDCANDDWFSVDVLWNLLQGNDQYRNMKSVNQLVFIKENFEDISGAFSVDRTGQTKEKLHLLEKSRSKKLFGC